MRKFVAALSVAALGAVACTTTGTSGGSASSAPEFKASGMYAHMKFLSDDLMEGREAGTRGHQLAANYVAAHLERWGATPGGDDGSYFQQVPLRVHTADVDASSASITQNGRTQNLVIGDDALISSSPLHTEYGASGDVVFVGYGIDDPLGRHNDYESLDVDGKIVVFLGGVPGDMDLASDEAAVLQSTGTKVKMAADHGAVAAFQLFVPAPGSGFNFERLRFFITRPNTTWVGADGSTRGAGLIGGVLSEAGAAKLFAGASTSLDDVIAASRSGAAVPTFDTGASMTFAGKSTHEDILSPNVAGVIPGTDPALKDEYIILSAHLDHIGIASEPQDGDAIRNGAMDNASGSSALLEVVRALLESGEPPRRSLMLLWVTAEEKGLLGASYFASNPTVPADNIVANINLDMPLLTYEFTDVVAFGAPRSTMSAALDAAAATIGVSVSPDPMPEQNLFVRSDHYEFVQKGIPSVFLFTGFENGGDEAFQNFFATNYHQVGDEIDQGIDFESAARFAHLNYEILRNIDAMSARPAWFAGDFFGQFYDGPMSDLPPPAVAIDAEVATE